MNTFLQSCNVVNRKHCQARSILDALLADDHFKEISGATLAGSLWAVREALEDAERGADAMLASWQAGRPARAAPAPLEDLQHEARLVMQEAAGELDGLQKLLASFARKLSPA